MREKELLKAGFEESLAPILSLQFLTEEEKEKICLRGYEWLWKETPSNFKNKELNFSLLKEKAKDFEKRLWIWERSSPGSIEKLQLWTFLKDGIKNFNELVAILRSEKLEKSEKDQIFNENIKNLDFDQILFIVESNFFKEEKDELINLLRQKGDCFNCLRKLVEKKIIRKEKVWKELKAKAKSFEDFKFMLKISSPLDPDWPECWRLSFEKASSLNDFDSIRRIAPCESPESKEAFDMMRKIALKDEENLSPEEKMKKSRSFAQGILTIIPTSFCFAVTIWNNIEFDIPEKREAFSSLKRTAKTFADRKYCYEIQRPLDPEKREAWEFLLGSVNNLKEAVECWKITIFNSTERKEAWELAKSLATKIEDVLYLWHIAEPNSSEKSEAFEIAKSKIYSLKDIENLWDKTEKGSLEEDIVFDFFLELENLVKKKVIQ